jgi:hypothetical protein
MMDSGGISGWLLDTGEDLVFLAQKLEGLARRSLNIGESPFLFAVGDGNHSLAAAKGIWEEYKNTLAGGVIPDHPLRYALVEIENLYDQSIQFEPIHRIVFGMDLDETISLLSKLPDFSCSQVKNREELVCLCREPCAGNRFGIISGDNYALVNTSASGISTARLQPLLDQGLNKPASIDYIHDDEELFRLSQAKGGKVTGILLPPVNNAGLFETVARTGPLPRKSFSMGHASEKRFYLECRKLV